MKNIYKLLFILSLLLMSGCDYNLNINTDPNTPQEASCDLRLPNILSMTADVYGSHGMRTSLLIQQTGFIYSVGNRNYDLQNWKFQNNAETYIWQSWYIYIWINIRKMIEDANAKGAWHYVGVGKAMEAFGCAFVVDAYGIMAYKDGLSNETFMPTYDDASTVYEKLLPLCDEAIDFLSREQLVAAPALSKADTYYKGDTKKWIKFVYALKARLLSHMTKKTVGTGFGNYNPDAIITLIDKSFESSADDAEMKYIKGSKVTVEQSINFQNVSFSNKPGKLFTQYLLNTVPGTGNSWNSGIEDPRAEKMIPKIETGSMKGKYSLGVDLDFTDSKPIAKDSSYFGLAITDKSAPSGKRGTTIFTQDDFSYTILSYFEILFIKAETYFRKGDKANALKYYKDAIAAHMSKLKVDPAKAQTFLSSAAVAQTASELTLSHIMIQKYIALVINPEAWTDMRRCDFCLDAGGNYSETEGVYKGFKRPKFAYELNFGVKGYPRRYQMAYMERDYNAVNVRPWGVFEPDYMTYPVWWDKK